MNGIKRTDKLSKLVKLSTGLDYKACTWLRDFLPTFHFPKIAVRQTVGGRGAAEDNSKLCKPFSPTQYIRREIQYSAEWCEVCCALLRDGEGEDACSPFSRILYRYSNE